MKRYGLLCYRTGNYGDDIQSVAAQRLLPHVDLFVERDRLSKYKRESPFSLILNGWYMCPPYGGIHMYRWYEKQYHSIIAKITGKDFDWPPPPNIRPLIIGHHVHINSILNKEGLAFYKKYEPIGCRDLYTQRLLEKHGIKAYFSGCLSLTLENKAQKREDRVVFADPFSWSEGHRFRLPGHPDFKKGLWRKFPKKIRENCEFVTHDCYGRKELYPLTRAEELIDIYSSAKLVVTSRIHVALPCLALKTPVIFLYNKETNDGRFDGVMPFLRSYSFEDVRHDRLKIDWENPEPNPGDISHLANDLRERCHAFVKAGN